MKENRLLNKIKRKLNKNKIEKNLENKYLGSSIIFQLGMEKHIFKHISEKDQGCEHGENPREWSNTFIKLNEDNNINNILEYISAFSFTTMDGTYRFCASNKLSGSWYFKKAPYIIRNIDEETYNRKRKLILSKEFELRDLYLYFDELIKSADYSYRKCWDSRTGLVAHYDVSGRMSFTYTDENEINCLIDIQCPKSNVSSNYLGIYKQRTLDEDMTSSDIIVKAFYEDQKKLILRKIEKLKESLLEVKINKYKI
jgi:hypothetical protein